MRALRLAPASVLAVYAHPDDADVAAGGTLCAWARGGARVHLVVVCDGAKGSHAPQESGALRDRRRAELERAAARLGIAATTRLNRPDGEVTNDVELRRALVGLVRAERPEVVIGPDPTAVFFAGVYVNHRDHRETGWALLDAVAPAAAMPLYFPEMGEAHRVQTLLLSGTHEPDVVVDVSTAIEEKVAAVAAHVSQLDVDAEATLEAVRERAAAAGRPVGAAFGEAFRCLELAF